MSEDMINVKKMTSLIKMRRNRIIHSNLNLDICDGFKSGCVARRGARLGEERNPNREGEASGSATNIAACCGGMWGICKKSLNIIKSMHVVFNSYNMLFGSAKKLSSLMVCALLLTSCSYTTEEAAYNFEDRLESFIGKSMQELIRRCGQPARYLNESDVPGDTSGTYMIYSYKRNNSECEVILKYQKRTMKIIDWDYSGYCMNTNRFKLDDGCFGL